MSAEETISIEGRLLMLDNITPHVAVSVQAIQSGKVIAAETSYVNGDYHLFNLEPGLYQLRCQVLGGYVYYRANDAVLSAICYEELSSEERIGDFINVENSTLRNINFRFAQFKKGTWKNITYQDGLIDHYITSIRRDPDGIMWFGTTEVTID